MSSYQVDATYLYKWDYRLVLWFTSGSCSSWIIFITTTLCVSFVDCRVYGVPVELDGEDDDLEGEQSGYNMEGECWGFMGLGGIYPPTPPM